MPTIGPFAVEFAYAPVANSLGARIRTRRQMYRSQPGRLHADLTTRATRFPGRPVEAMIHFLPYLRTTGSTSDLIYVESPRGTYAEVPLRYGDTPEPTSEKPDDDNQSPGEGIRQHDPGSLPTTAPDADQASTAELLPGSPEALVSGNDGSRPVGAHPLIGAHVIREVVREEMQGSWSAPLPPPETLDQYNKIVPGAAERILSMTERVLTGKIDTVDKLANSEIEWAKISISVAFGLTLLAFAASVAFFALNNRVAGLAFLSFPVVMLIRSFLVRSDRTESVDS